jgi:hypothetical protein
MDMDLSVAAETPGITREFAWTVRTTTAITQMLLLCEESYGEARQLIHKNVDGKPQLYAEFTNSITELTVFTTGLSDVDATEFNALFSTLRSDGGEEELIDCVVEQLHIAVTHDWDLVDPDLDDSSEDLDEEAWEESIWSEEEEENHSKDQ